MNLIERLAGIIAEALLREFPAREVRVRVRKLTAPLDGALARPASSSCGRDNGARLSRARLERGRPPGTLRAAIEPPAGGAADPRPEGLVALRDGALGGRAGAPAASGLVPQLRGRVETALAARPLLERVQAIETRSAARAARHAGGASASRRARVDIDILLYDDRVISVPDALHVPTCSCTSARSCCARSPTSRPTWSIRPSTAPCASCWRSSTTSTRSGRATIRPRWFELSRDGDRPDFEREALAHLDALYNFAIYLTRKPAEAEDLVQETYVRAFRFSHRFQPGTHLRAWLFQILRNTFLTFYRLHEREAPLAEDGVPDWDAPMFHDAPDETPASLEAHTDLERALRRLPEEFRTVLLLAEVEGLPLEEVAQVMHCPVGTVKSRIFRAKERLARACCATTRHK